MTGRDLTFAKLLLPSPARLRRVAFVLEQLDAEMLIAIGLWAIARRDALAANQRRAA